MQINLITFVESIACRARLEARGRWADTFYSVYQTLVPDT